MVRSEVDYLVSLGTLPAEQNADPSLVETFQRALESISPPVTTQEAKELLNVFGPDDCFGGAWTLLHLIETAPETPLTSTPPSDANEWVRYLWDRAHR